MPRAFETSNPTPNGTPPPTQPNLMYSKQFHKLGTKFSIFDPMGPFNHTTTRTKTFPQLCLQLHPASPVPWNCFCICSIFFVQHPKFHYSIFIHSLLLLVILPHYSPPPIYPHPTVAFFRAITFLLSHQTYNVFSYSFSIFRLFFSLSWSTLQFYDLYTYMYIDRNI